MELYLICLFIIAPLSAQAGQCTDSVPTFVRYRPGTYFCVGSAVYVCKEGAESCREATVTSIYYRAPLPGYAGDFLGGMISETTQIHFMDDSGKDITYHDVSGAGSEDSLTAFFLPLGCAQNEQGERVCVGDQITAFEHGGDDCLVDACQGTRHVGKLLAFSSVSNPAQGLMAYRDGKGKVRQAYVDLQPWHPSL